MKNIPDFVLQVQEVERNLKAHWRVLQDEWQCDAARRFNSNIIDPYTDNFKHYIKGDKIKGLGLDKLLQQMDKHLQDMEQLTGVPADVAFECATSRQHDGKVINWFGNVVDVENDECVVKRDGIVHDELRNRDYWNDNPESYKPEDEYDGVKPGELGVNEIQYILNQKNKKYGI